MRTRSTTPAVRVVGVVALVVVAAVELNSTPDHLPAATTTGQGWTAGMPSFALATMSSLAGLVMVIWAWRHLRRGHGRSNDPEPNLTPTWNPTRREQLLALVLGLAALAAPWLLLVASTHAPRILHFAPLPPTRSGEPRVWWAQPPGAFGGSAFALGAALGLVLLALVAAHWVHRRRQTIGTPYDAPSRLSDLPTAAHPPTQVAPRASWIVSDNNRARVIAAFTTLQAAASSHGVTSGATETPDEFLDRVCTSDARLVDDSTIITNLFQRARFSDLKLYSHDARSAETALRGVLSRLGSRP